MQLARAVFDRIASTVSGEASPAAAERAIGHRRNEPRLGVDSRVTIIPLTDRLAAAPFQVTIRDLSPGGIGFLHAGKISLDEQFVVLLPDGDESVAVLCEVAYYQPLARDVFSVGARFVRVLRQPADDSARAIPLVRPAAVARRAAS